MHIEIVRTGSGTSVATSPSQPLFAGGEPGHMSPEHSARPVFAIAPERQGGAGPVRGGAASPQKEGHGLLVQVDGQTVVEIAGFQDEPGVVLQGSAWMQGESADGTGCQEAAPSFFGQVTNDLAPLLGGTAEAGSLVLVGVGGAVFCVTATEAGNWTLDTATAKPLSGHFALGSDGPKELVITSVDSTGNSTGVAGYFILDTQPPSTPTLHPLVCTSPLPVLSGRAESGSTVMVGVGGAIYLVAAEADGQWRLDTASATPSSGRFFLGPDGVKHVVLACTDEVGNTSTGDGSFTLDTRGAGTQAAQDGGNASDIFMTGAADATKTLFAALGARGGALPQRQR